MNGDNDMCQNDLFDHNVLIIILNLIPKEQLL